ncbi:MAG: hypothetical protein NC310_04930 [Roseburia sp.]|nr:hypothetical protein [Anaeroplasma bactoclasticum]MCM1196404.1 hypothetical protein [Roseburia sp.]MCM1556332.1 hypothetical protein [Anaeroplasma bactoclasticum]
MKIGIIDSGKGGLAVAKQIKNKEDQLIIFLDQGFFPYGNKPKEILLKRAYYLSKCLIEQGAELIVLACNTLSILAYSFLKYNLKVPVIGIFDYFIPYLTPNHTLIGSNTTISYAKENYSVNVIDGTDFIEAIEKKKDISFYLDELKNLKTDLLLLGCTHFLAIPLEAYPLPTLNQIPMLLEDIKRARKISSP